MKYPSAGQRMKFLVIRRDNIGDLVCTTPLFAALRKKFPDAVISAFVNSYNAPVLDGNPNIDQVFIYKKAKHRKSGESKVAVWVSTLKLVSHLRRKHWDYAIVATTAYSKSALKFARGVKSRRIIAFAPRDKKISDPVDPFLIDGLHETEAVFQLLKPLDIFSRPGPVEVFAKNVLSNNLPEVVRPVQRLVGLHISARKKNQRWSVENFARLAHQLHKMYKDSFLVFWSPGPSDHPQHPGDDKNAERMNLLCNDIPLTLYPTENLEELINGLSLCDYIICSDGGGMHLAAGLGKPIVCLFGNSSITRWHPWGVPYELLQNKSKLVRDLSVEDVRSSVKDLLERV